MLKKKKLFCILILEIILCFFSSILVFRVDFTVNDLFKIPFVQIASVLRKLSLGSSLGNCLAIILYLGISFVPIIYLGYRLIKKKSKLEDVLLVVLAITLASMLYFFINPGLMSRFVYHRPLVCGYVYFAVVFYAFVFAYISFRWLRSCSDNSQDKLDKNLKVIFHLICILLIVGAVLVGTYKLQVNLKTLVEKNSKASFERLFTSRFYIMKYLFSMVILVLNLSIVCKAMELFEEMKINTFSNEVVKLAKKLGRLCTTTVVVLISSNLGICVSQLFLTKYMLNVKMNANLPITEVLGVMIVMILTRTFVKGNELKQNNEMFI